MGRRCSARGQRQRLTAGHAQAAAWVQRGRRSACTSLPAKGQHAARRCTRHRPTPAARPATFGRGAGGSSHPRERRPALGGATPGGGTRRLLQRRPRGSPCPMARVAARPEVCARSPPPPAARRGSAGATPRCRVDPQRHNRSRQVHLRQRRPAGPVGHRPRVRVLSCAYTRLPSSCAAHCRQLRPHLASAAARSPTSLGGDRQADPDTATPERPRRRVTLL